MYRSDFATLIVEAHLLENRLRLQISLATDQKDTYYCPTTTTEYSMHQLITASNWLLQPSGQRIFIVPKTIYEEQGFAFGSVMAVVVMMVMLITVIKQLILERDTLYENAA